MTYVWEVHTTGGDPMQVKAAVERAIMILRADVEDVPELQDHEREVWAKDISSLEVGEPAYEAGAVSVLVDIDIFGEETERVAAILSGGFDTAVLDEVMQVANVTEATHSDRIKREAT